MEVKNSPHLPARGHRTEFASRARPACLSRRFTLGSLRGGPHNTAAVSLELGLLCPACGPVGTYFYKYKVSKLLLPQNGRVDATLLMPPFFEKRRFREPRSASVATKCSPVVKRSPHRWIRGSVLDPRNETLRNPAAILDLRGVCLSLSLSLSLAPSPARLFSVLVAMYCYRSMDVASQSSVTNNNRRLVSQFIFAVL